MIVEAWGTIFKLYSEYEVYVSVTTSRNAHQCLNYSLHRRCNSTFVFYMEWKVFLPDQEDSLSMVGLVEMGENDGKMIRRQHRETQWISK